MFFIDEPYVSAYLAQQLERQQYPVVMTPQSKKLLSDYRINFISLDEARKILEDDIYHPIYMNSENSLSYISGWESWFPAASSAALCKDKAAFREHIQPFYPDFFFRRVHLDDLGAVNPEELVYPCIIKPSLGFFSLSVHYVENAQMWTAIVGKIRKEAQIINRSYPSTVVAASDFIIEECIEGEEYAVDAYYDRDGIPVVMGIYHHLFSSGSDVSDRVYMTSSSIRAEVRERVIETLEHLNREKRFRVFPIHAELRISSRHGCIPIEVNPLRFGGWCTTGDLNGYAQGLGQYQAFMEQMKPNLLQDPEGQDDIFSVIVLDNSTGIEPHHIRSFSFDALEHRLSGVLEIRPVDHRRFNVFGFVFARTPKKQIAELYEILSDNLRDFVIVEQE
jgi:hypothetical protein